MKKPLKSIIVCTTALVMVWMLFIAGNVSGAAAPLLQMTPSVDPMSVPTVEAPALDAQNGLPGSSTTTMMANGQMSCPMMSESMGAGSNMTGMSGMPGMSGMSGTMAGGMSMGQIGSMPMAGTMDLDDALSNTQAGFFYNLNPWLLVGWIILFILVVALLAFLVLGIIWMVRQIRKDKPVVTG